MGLDGADREMVSMPTLSGGTYITTPDGLSVEVLVGPRELDAHYGFVPAARFPRQLRWPGPLRS